MKSPGNYHNKYMWKKKVDPVKSSSVDKFNEYKEKEL